MAIDIPGIAWKLTGFRPDLPDATRIDVLREAAVILCREGRCLRETITVNQKTNDPFVNPFANETPATRVSVAIMGMMLAGQELPSLGPGDMLNAKFPQDLGLGIPAAFVPLYDGRAMLDARPNVDCTLHVLVAYAPFGRFNTVDLPPHMEDMIVVGARYLLMTRPGKGKDFSYADRLRSEFAAYVHGLRATSTAGLSPQDYTTLDQAPLRATMPALPVDPVDPGGNPGGNPGGGTMPSTLTTGQIFTNGVAGITGTMTMNVMDLLNIYAGWDFTSGFNTVTSGKMTMDVLRNGQTTSAAVDITNEMLTEGYVFEHMPEGPIDPGFGLVPMPNFESGDIVTIKVFVNGGAVPCFAACVEMPAYTISMDATWGQPGVSKTSAKVGLTLTSPNTSGQISVSAFYRSTFDSGEMQISSGHDMPMQAGRTELNFPTSGIFSGVNVVDTGYLFVRVVKYHPYVPGAQVVWVCRLDQDGTFTQGLPGTVPE